MLIGISISALLVSYITTSSINNMMDRTIKYNITFRTIYVSKKDRSPISMEDIEKLNHIDKVVEQENFILNVDIVNLDNERNDGAVNLIGCNHKTSPQVIIGRNLYENEDNACIIPMNFYTGNIYDKINDDEIINGKNLLDKEIEISYSTYKYVEGAPLKEEERIKKMKVVGVYDSEEIMGNFNECFVDFSVIEEINKIVSYGTGLQAGYQPVLAIVDNAENLDNVLQELSNLNYKTKVYSVPNYTIINMINLIGRIIAISSMVLALINIIFNSIKNSQDRKKEYGLLKALGFKSSDIWCIVLVESLMLGIVSFVIACIITFTIILVLMKVKSNADLEIQKIKLTINYISFIICFGIAIVVPSVGNLLSSIKILKNSVVYNSKE